MNLKKNFFFREDENSPKHIRIKEREGKYYIKSEDGYFESIDALVKHYFSNPITKKGKTLDTPLDFHEVTFLFFLFLISFNGFHNCFL